MPRPLKRNDREGNAIDIRVFFGDNSRFGRASHLLSVYGPEIEAPARRRCCETLEVPS